MRPIVRAKPACRWQSPAAWPPPCRPSQPLLPHPQAQGLSHLAEAMEGTFPPRFQRMTEELCEVRHGGAGESRLQLGGG